jgi:hypothetical protein
VRWGFKIVRNADGTYQYTRTVNGVDKRGEKAGFQLSDLPPQGPTSHLAEALGL